MANTISPNNPLPTWDQIVASDEFKYDYQYVFNILASSINTSVFTAQSAHLQLAAQLVTLCRWYTRHIKDQRDIDRTSFFNYLAAEIGYDIPFLQNFSAVELLREARYWFQTKGTWKLLPFISDLVGSPVTVDDPSRLVFKFSDPNSCFSGALTPTNQPLPMAQSKLARFQDNDFWTYFTYLITVTQAQNAVDLVDMESILDNIHPAGTQRFTNYQYQQISDDSDLVVPGILIEQDIMEEYGMNQAIGRSFDNGFLFSDPASLFDTNTAFDTTLLTLSIQEFPVIGFGPCWLTLGDAELPLTKQIFKENRSNRPQVCFERYKPAIASGSTSVSLIVTSTQNFTITMAMGDHYSGIHTNSVRVFFNNVYVAVDNGSGALTFVSGYSNYSGTVNYTTGVITITVTSNAVASSFTATAGGEYYNVVYSDNDPLVAANVANNVGFQTYNALDQQPQVLGVSDLTNRQVKNAAQNLDGNLSYTANEPWMSDGLIASWAITARTGSFTGSTTNGSAVITTTNTSGLSVGQSLSGGGIVSGSTISSIVANTSVTINHNATSTTTNETINYW